MASSPKYVVICERKTDAPSAIKNIKDGKIKFFSTSPEVCYELDKVGIKYTDIETLFPMDHVDTDEAYDLVLRMCSDIDMANSSNAAKDNFFFVKMLFDALYIRAVALKRMIEKEKPDEIVIFVDEAESSDIMYPFGDSDNIYATLLQTGKFKCKYTITARPRAVKPATVKREGKNKREVPRSVYNILFCIKHRGLGIGIKTILYMLRNKIRIRKKTLLAMSKYNYSWQYIIPELTRAGFDFVTLDLDEFAVPSMVEPTTGLDLAKRYCVADGIDFSEPFLKILGKKLQLYDAKKNSIYHSVRLAIKKYRPYAMIGSTKTTATEHLIARTASDFWIPVVTWQHGSAYPPNFTRMMPFNEMMDSDMHLTFGEGYDGFNRKFGCQLVPVGSYDLERLYFGSRKAKKEFDILYVTSNYSGNLLYSSPTTDIRLWKAQKPILDFLAKNKHLRVAVKLHPVSRDDHPAYKYLGAGNIEIFRNERTYRDLLKHSRVVIIDCPSTTLLEAMAAGKEIFVLSDQVKLTEEQKALMKKRAYFFEDANTLVSTLGRYVMGEIIEDAPDKTNNEFLLRYGLHALNGRVAERAVSALRKLGKRK